MSTRPNLNWLLGRVLPNLLKFEQADVSFTLTFMCLSARRVQGLLHAGTGGPRVFAAAGLAGCTTNALLYPLEVCSSMHLGWTAACAACT